jgi:hypothetical protein
MIMGESPGADPIEAVSIDPRFPASAVRSITGVRLSPGDMVELVNISRSGVLVEGRTRFVPGTRVTVMFEGSFSPSHLKGRIVRCQVSSIHDGSLRYQSGIQFEKKLEAHPGEVHEQPPAPVAPAPAAAPAKEPAVPVRLMNRW